MSDFLTRLAQRSLGEAALISPRLPSLFAPFEQEGALGGVADFISHNTSEIHGASFLSPQSATSPSPHVPRQEKTAVEADDAARSSLAAAAVGDKTASHNNLGVARRKSDDTAISLVAHRSGHPLPNPHSIPGDELFLPSHAQDGVTVNNTGFAADQPKYAPTSSFPSSLAGEGLDERGRSFTAQSPLVSAHKIKSSEAHSLSAVAVELSDQQRPAAPTIHISIGRVEVRANIASPPPAPRPQAEHKPSQSLADYLKRGGGKP